MKFFNRHVIQTIAILLLSGIVLFFHIIWPKFSFDQRLTTDDRLVEINNLTGVERFVFGLPIDINTATPDDLVLLPGIGPKTAVKIVAERGQNGPFKSIDDLLRVKGITRKKLLVLKPFLLFSFARQEAFQTLERQIGKDYEEA